jgi:hypothetical protein
MKENRTVSESSLRQAFGDMPKESLPPALVESIGREVEKVALNRQKEKAWMLPAQIVAGVSGMILILLLSVHLCNLFVPGFHFSFSDIHINIDPYYITIGLAILILLIIDELLAKRLRLKKLKDK